MKYRLLIVFLMLFQIAAIAYGQVVSRVWSFPEEASSDLLLRSYGSTYQTLTYYKNGLLGNHVFMYTQTPGYTFKYTFPMMANHYGALSYTVSDMKIAGDCCFFCGSFFTPSQPIQPPGFIDPLRDASAGYCGYFACMHLDSINLPIDPDLYNLKCRFVLVDNTLELTKLVVFEHDHDTVLGLIGKFDSPDNPSCLVSVKKTANQGWQSFMWTLDTNYEVFSDIVLTDKSLVVASRFREEPYTFGLRYVGLADFFYDDNISDFKTLNKFNTTNVREETSNRKITWHREDAAIRLVAIPNSDDVTVGYESHFFLQDSNNFNSFNTLYYVSGTQYGISITNSCSFHSSAQFYEVLKGMQYVPHDDRIALILSFPTHVSTKGCVYLFSWNTETAVYYPSTDFDMSAMDVAAGRYLWTVGRSPSDNKIHQLCQDQNVCSGCFWCVEENSISHLDPLPDHTTSETHFTPHLPLVRELYNVRVKPTRTTYSLSCVEEE